MQTDLKAGKMTLAVKIGRKNAIALYIVFNVFAFITPFILTLLIKNNWVLLPIISFPFSVYLIRNLIKYSGTELNRVLAGTGQLLIMYGTLSCVGFLL
jgi:1,4-dihydroxy-2-naphthoate octaprenyltransferase